MGDWSEEIRREERVSPPVHPGEVLLQGWLEPLGMNPNRLAKALGVDRQDVYEIVNGERGISAEMASRLGRWSGIRPEFWLGLQNRYDLEVEQERAGKSIESEVQPLEPEMDPMLLRMFQWETLEQCTYILIAAAQLDERTSAQSYDDVFWRELQTFVVSTANVSKLLWGQRGRFAKKREALRKSIGVEDSSPLKPTTMRNHFEHIDERLDRWWAESATHNIANHNVGPPDMIAGMKEIELFRAYDPSTHTVGFWGDTYDLKEIVEEVGRIYPLLLAEAEKPHWQE